MDHLKVDGGGFKSGVEDIWPGDVMDFTNEDLLAYMHNGDVRSMAYDSHGFESFLLNYLPYSLVDLLVGPAYVLLDLAPIMRLVLITRIAHLIADLTIPGQKLIKNLTTCALGCFQINSYLKTIELGSWSARYFTFPVIIAYLLTTKVAKLLTRRFNHKSKHRLSATFPTLVIVLAPIVINEYFIYSKRYQHHTNLRMILMTLAMKSTSLIFDKSPKNGLSSLAYLVHPASCIFGPWHVDFPEPEAQGSTRAGHLLRFRCQVIKAFQVFIKTLAILFVSTSLLDLISQLLAIKFGRSAVSGVMSVYLRAQEFRFSHYSLCYVALSFLTLWTDPKEELEICRLFEVEWPRSLRQVVVSWNIPIHKWLKDYVFHEIKTHKFAAILATYLISSTLHGFKFHIWAVLLSLGFLTWIEHVFRHKLATRLSACILTKTCRYSDKGKCMNGHRKTSLNSMQVRAINFAFRVLAIVHLAYLGYIFKGDTDTASYHEAVDSWSELYFYSHAIAVVTYVISLTIRGPLQHS